MTIKRGFMVMLLVWLAMVVGGCRCESQHMATEDPTFAKSKPALSTDLQKRFFPLVKTSTTRPHYMPLSNPLQADGEEYVLWPIQGQSLVVLDPEAIAVWIYNAKSTQRIFGQEAKGGPGMVVKWSASEDQAGNYVLLVVRGGSLIESSSGDLDTDVRHARRDRHDLFYSNLVIMLCGSPGTRSGC